MKPKIRAYSKKYFDWLFLCNRSSWSEDIFTGEYNPYKFTVVNNDSLN